MLLAEQAPGDTGTVEDIGIEPTDLTLAVIVLPPVISAINQRAWSSEIKGLVAIAVCVVYSLLACLLRADTDWQSWRSTFVQVLIGTFGAYKILWNPSDLGPRIETWTSPPPKPGEQLPPPTLCAHS